MQTQEKQLLGLRENWQQFTILAIINAFVGGMVGLERTILPQIAEAEFNMVAKTAILSFIAVFGFTKAIANYYTGFLAQKIGRKKLLVLGWIVGIPVPLLLMWAPSWNWIILANILLGINQGLAWSSTVVMKIDLVGEKNRGLAMGLNEFAGYIALAITAFVTGWIASRYGLRPYPFYLGIGLSVAGLLTSWLFVKDTSKHMLAESANSHQPNHTHIFWQTTWLDKNLGSVTQAGLINNLNDGMSWGIFPVLLANKGFTLTQIGLVVSIYPAVWGISQLFTGKLADHVCKKQLLFWGMLVQGVVLLLMIYVSAYELFLLLSALLGLGTAMVYPTFLATIAQYTHPEQRSESIGIFRLWRDAGYAVGAVLTGVFADILGILASVTMVGLLTLLSAFIIYYRMSCREDSQRKKELIHFPKNTRPYSA